MPDTADLLKSVPIFEDLAETDRAALARELERVTVPSGGHMCSFGDPGDSMFIIRTGEVEVLIHNDTGEEIVLERCGPGGFLGEISLLDLGPRTATIRAATDVDALRLSRSHLDHFLAKHPAAGAAMLTIMGRRLRRTGEKLRHTATRNVNAEIADNRTFLVRAADAIAAFAGSIAFVLIHAALFALWLIWNSVSGVPHFDREGFPILTMIVSLEAIFLSTFVLLAANRQAEKDRVRADIEYDVNLKAELEIAHLHVKLDSLRSDSLARLAKIEARLDAPPSARSGPRAG